jgi:RecB family exonuclease
VNRSTNTESLIASHKPKMHVTPRTTRLVRVADLPAFRRTVAKLASDGSPLEARNRLVLVPTRAAGRYLTASIEQQFLASSGALILPDFITRSELHAKLAERLPRTPLSLSAAEREVLMGVACRMARESGIEPPFRLRPGLIAAILEFYDTLHRNMKHLDTFERLALGMLEPGAVDDRGAERLVRQTNFLLAAFRRFEQSRNATSRVDEHLLRQLLLMETGAHPWRHIVVTVGDRSSDADGLFAADWDLLARIQGLEQLDVVVTETILAGAFHECIHQRLPGIDEVRLEERAEQRVPVLVVPPGGSHTHTARDREEEIAGFARWVRQQQSPLDRMALVVARPLPYVYLAREMLRSAGIASQMFDALPLAAEPYACALDLVFTCVSSNFARRSLAALLRSPHFQFPSQSAGRGGSILFAEDESTLPVVAALDRALSKAGYLGDVDFLERLVEKWETSEPRSSASAAPHRMARVVVDAARALAPLRSEASCAEHLDRLLAFLAAHERLPAADDPLRARLLRGRAAVIDVLASLRDVYARFDSAPVDFATVTSIVRRWIQERTFAPYTGEQGVHVVDVSSARFGDFDHVQLAGLVDGEWPERPRRNIFYPAALLRELDWPSEAARLDRTRAEFLDLLRLPEAFLAVSTFTLEDDVVVSPSPLVDALADAGLPTLESALSTVRIFDYEALAHAPAALAHLSDVTRAAASRRIEVGPAPRERAGMTSAHSMPAYAVSALEQYQDCPFKFFAAHVLRLEEPPQDEPTLSPKERGKFIHELFQKFFEAWDRRGDGTITPDRTDEARALFEEVAEPMLGRLSESEAGLERARLFGSAASMGIVDVVLGLEAARPAEVRERWLEFGLEGMFSLGAASDRRLALRGVADRIDLLSGNRLRVIDYKSGYPPNPKRALQVAVYALCAKERLDAQGPGPWTVDEAAYVAFSGKRALIPVVRAGAPDTAAVLAAARDRVLDIVSGIEQGVFPARPHDMHMCTYCAYPSVCRKDYVGDE